MTILGILLAIATVAAVGLGVVEIVRQFFDAWGDRDRRWPW